MGRSLCQKAKRWQKIPHAPHCVDSATSPSIYKGDRQDASELSAGDLAAETELRPRYSGGSGAWAQERQPAVPASHTQELGAPLAGKSFSEGLRWVKTIVPQALLKDLHPELHTHLRNFLQGPCPRLV